MKNKKPVISVIVPVYMVSDYLDMCIASIVNQSYSNLEIILVDDGSRDDCGNKCDEWAKKDARIIVIHTINGGQAVARNYGMEIACGDYVSFIDSDDYVSVHYIEVLLTTALEHDSDIVVCDFDKFNKNGEYEEYHDDMIISNYSGFDGLSALIDGYPFHLHVWDKLYKQSVIQEIYFEAGKIHEDVFWLYRAFGQSKRITKVNLTLYFYLQRESSTMGQGYSLRSMDFLEGKNSCLLYIEKYFPELAPQSKLDFFGSCIYMMQCVLKYMSGNEKRQAVAIIRKYKKNCNITFKELSSVSGGAKKYYYLAKINIYWCCKIRAVLNLGF